MAHGRHSFRYTVAILSAIAIWIACLLQALQSFDLTGGVQPNFRDQAYQNNTRTLDPGTLRAYFNWKNGQRGVDVAIDLFASAGLGGLAYTVLVLKRVFRRHKGGDSDLPNLMSACFFIGALLPSIQFLQSLGSTVTSDWISQLNGLPDVGIQAVFVATRIQQGAGLYMFSIQFLFVSFGLAVSSHLTWKTSDLPSKHGVFGAITAAFGFMSFIFEIAAFNAQTMGVSITFGFFVLIYGVLLLPIWMIWLGIELKRLKMEQRQGGEDGIKLSEI